MVGIDGEIVDVLGFREERAPRFSAVLGIKDTTIPVRGLAFLSPGGEV